MTRTTHLDAGGGPRGSFAGRMVLTLHSAPIMGGRRGGAALALALSVVVSRSAAAAPTIAWEAPEECPARRHVEREIEALAPRGATDDVVADVRVVRTEQGTYRTTIRERRAGAGDRSLDADTCDQAAEAAAVIVAMLTGPGDDEVASAVPSRAVPRSEPAPAGPVVADDVAAVVPARPPLFSASIAGVIDAGSLPSAAPGGRLAVGLRVGKVRLEGSALLLPVRTAAAGDAGKGGEVGLTAGRVTVGVPIIATWEVSPALGMELGWMSAEGFGVRRPREDGAVWLAAVAGVTARYPARSRVAAQVGAEAVLPILRTGFELAGNTVHVPGAVSGRTSLGVVVDF